MKRRYRVKVSVEGSTEETQFIPLADSTPRIKTRYKTDPAAHGKFRDGMEYSIDPDKVDEAEEALASEDPAAQEQRRQEREAERVTKKGKK